MKGVHLVINTNLHADGLLTENIMNSLLCLYLTFTPNYLYQVWSISDKQNVGVIGNNRKQFTDGRTDFAIP